MNIRQLKHITHSGSSLWSKSSNSTIRMISIRVSIPEIWVFHLRDSLSFMLIFCERNRFHNEIKIPTNMYTLYQNKNFEFPNKTLFSTFSTFLIKPPTIPDILFVSVSTDMSENNRALKNHVDYCFKTDNIYVFLKNHEPVTHSLYQKKRP